MSEYHPDPRTPSLGEGFFVAVEPARFPRARLRFRNDLHARSVGLGALTPEAWEAHFARFEALPGNLPRPLALRYHGHQFGVYNPNLGDGRGFLFAQLRDDRGRLLDLGTKGSGQTPWSRGGDGRLTLKGGVREVLATEMLEALGVDTSKTFSLFETGESLERHDEPSPTRASVLVRLSHGHVRVGTFQCFAYRDDRARLQRLLDFCVEHYHPALAGDRALPAAFLRAVAERCADTCARWMSAGFVHGVLNTDNLNITGESFDYGPWRFNPTCDRAFTAAYFDHSGLYAYGRQPQAVQWSLARLAEALAPLGADGLGQALDAFQPAFNNAFARAVCQRLGVTPLGHDQDVRLVDTVYTFLETSKLSLDRFFFDWYSGPASEPRALGGAGARAYEGGGFLTFRRALEGYAPANPGALEGEYFQGDTPCTMVIDEVEGLWDPIARADDWSRFEAKVASVRALGQALKNASA
ncbi:MAG: YdiU family protein [Deltaproteobacteria bacterium]|nr:YdiU family protein [Deltaproteobacteria bacterium]